MDHPALFSWHTFEWLKAIHQHPSLGFYQAHKPEFQAYIERPLQSLMQQAAIRLPSLARALLETQRGIFSRFPKNDFGRGGAWDNYWGAFYPRGSRRIMDAQLAVWLDYRRLQISFYISDYGIAPRQRFRRNCARYLDILPVLLNRLIQNRRIVLSRGWDEKFLADGQIVPEHPMTWEEWLGAPQEGQFAVRLPLIPSQVIAMPPAELVSLVASTLSDYFPLALLSMDENPLPLLQAYLDQISSG